eukprot:scaffold77565_cov32-Tisochrysis_lutea.AAC.1
MNATHGRGNDDDAAAPAATKQLPYHLGRRSPAAGKGPATTASDVIAKARGEGTARALWLWL